MKEAKIAIIMGSDSDLPKIQSAIETLKELEIPHTVRVMSAHRTPEVVREFVGNAAANGLQVILAAAGCAAHLAGVAASHTILPVIGIPVQGGALNGLDALLSTVQMPPGIPVGTVAVGGGGPKNAAILAAEIIALQDEELCERLLKMREQQKNKVINSDHKLQNQLT